MYVCSTRNNNVSFYVSFPGKQTVLIRGARMWISKFHEIGENNAWREIRKVVGLRGRKKERKKGK